MTITMNFLTKAGCVGSTIHQPEPPLNTVYSKKRLSKAVDAELHRFSKIDIIIGSSG